MQAHPPGPGLPRHAPSVINCTFFIGSHEYTWEPRGPHRVPRDVMRRIPFHLFLVLAVVAGYLVWIADSRWSARPIAGAMPAGKPDIPKEYLPDGPGVKIVAFYTGTRE